MIFKKCLWFLSFIIKTINCPAKFVNNTVTNTNLESRIINGQEVNWNSTRYQVSIRLEQFDRFYFGTGHICGGSIIARNIVLTASHCIWNEYSHKFRAPNELTVVMGNVDRSANNNNTLKLSVTKIVTGEHFDYNTFRDDLAVLILNQSIPETYTAAKVIEINRNTDLKEGTICYVTGWGLTEKNSNPFKLMIAEVPIINRNTCSLNYGNETILDGMLCAGYMNGMRDACSGDSGGPLVCNDQLVGVVSFGFGCAIAGFPGVYTNVAYYYNWLSNQTRMLVKQNNLNDSLLELHATDNNDNTVILGNSIAGISFNTPLAGLIILGYLLRIAYLGSYFVL